MLTEQIELAKKNGVKFVCVPIHPMRYDLAIAKQMIADGGMIGLNLACGFIHEEREKQTVEYLFKHLDHCLELGGENNIGFGCDIDGIGRYPEPLTLEYSIHDQLIDYMQKHYSERIVEKVAGQNYLDYLKKWL